MYVYLYGVDCQFLLFLISTNMYIYRVSQLRLSSLISELFANGFL
jgi:hypothetical protein